MRRLVGVKTTWSDHSSNLHSLVAVLASETMYERRTVRIARPGFHSHSLSEPRLSARCLLGSFCVPVLPAASRSVVATRCGTRPSRGAQSPGPGFDPSLSARARLTSRAVGSPLRGHADPSHGVVALLGDPQTMHQHDKLAGHGDHRPFLRILRAAARQGKTLTAQTAVPPKRS